MKSTILAIMDLLLVAVPATMQSQFTYTINPTGTTLTITGYTGLGGAVTIPSSTNGLGVTSIGDDAVLGLTSLSSVTIPGSVTQYRSERLR